MTTGNAADRDDSGPPAEGTAAGSAEVRGRPGERGGGGGRGGAGDPVSAGIVDALRAFTTAMDRYIDVHSGAVGMHRTDLIALAHVMDAGRHGDHLTPSQLASALNLSAPATSALLGRLEAAGHVQRTHASSDRRRVSIEMTDDAMAVGRQVFGPLAVEMAAAIGTYGPQERELVLRFLQDVLAATARATDGRSVGR
jgi:DNA-binding MarR family transcriptional regulator